jgi:hypothetical protein
MEMRAMMCLNAIIFMNGCLILKLVHLQSTILHYTQQKQNHKTHIIILYGTSFGTLLQLLAIVLQLLVIESSNKETVSLMWSSFSRMQKVRSPSWRAE